MSKYFIIVTIIIVGLYILFLSRKRILWFIMQLKYAIKNRKKIKEIQKRDTNKRNLSNEQIKEYVELSRKYLNDMNLSTNREFKLKFELERHLIYSRFSEKYLLELLHEICKHMKLDSSKVKLRVNYISSKAHMEYAGLYFGQNEMKEIVLNIRNDMRITTVITILAHECTHYLLNLNGIKLDNRKENEYLTDITTAVLGFEKYMLDGYKISNDIVYESVQKRSVKKDRTGYLTYKDIKYVIKEIKK